MSLSCGGLLGEVLGLSGLGFGRLGEIGRVGLKKASRVRLAMVVRFCQWWKGGGEDGGVLRSTRSVDDLDTIEIRWWVMSCHGGFGDPIYGIPIRNRTLCS